jgi:membrane-associated phospholipid phosphatase
VIGLIFNLKKFTSLLQTCFISSLYAGLFNAILKFIFNRERPVIGFNPWHFFHFFVMHDNYNKLFYAYNSMSSGHTITVTAALSPLILHTKSLSIRVLLILVIILIAFSRIYTLNHWLSDVTVAFILGYLIGESAYLGREPKSRNK